MADFKFTNEEARKEYEEKLNALQKIVEDNSVDSAYLWDATVQKYAAKMEKVKKILQMEGINELINVDFPALMAPTRAMWNSASLQRCRNVSMSLNILAVINSLIPSI